MRGQINLSAFGTAPLIFVEAASFSEAKIVVRTQ